MLQSSAIATSPLARDAVRAFANAFSANVEPSSDGSSTQSGSGATDIPSGSSSRANSLSLWALRVARRRSRGEGTGEPRSACRHSDRLVLKAAQALDPGRGECEQLVEVRARERCSLRGGLDLDEASLSGHDHV